MFLNHFFIIFEHFCVSQDVSSKAPNRQ